MSGRQLIRGFLINMLVAAGVFLPSLLLAGELELRLRGYADSTLPLAFVMGAAALNYIGLLLPVLLGSIVHSASLWTIPSGASARTRRLVTLALASLVPSIGVLPSWGLSLLSVFGATAVATLAYGLCCTTDVGRTSATGTTPSASSPVQNGDVSKIRSTFVEVLVAAPFVALVLIGLAVERRASLCGAGWLPVNLPYDLQGVWYIGEFELNDASGLDVLGFGAKLEAGDELNSIVRSVNRYTLEHGFIAEVVLGSGEIAYVALERPAGSPIQTRRLTPEALRQRAGGDLESVCWVDVRRRSCLYGLFWPARALVLLGLAVALIFALRPSRPA